MRILYTVIVLAAVVATGWGCKEAPQGNMPVIQPDWEVYENQEYGFAFQYHDKYTFNQKEAGDTAAYMGTEMNFLFSMHKPSATEGPEPILYAFFAQDMTLDQFKELTQAGYGGVEGTGQIVEENTIFQGGIELSVLKNTTAMGENLKENYIQVQESGLLIFSPFIYQESDWEEMLPTLRELE